jgi:hypothetical protein
VSLGAIVAAVVLLSIASPIAAVVLLARFSGSSTLAERYPGRTRPAKVRRRLGYGVFRGWIGYNGGLVVGSDAEGLDLRAMPVILSFCHPPIFIPWRELARIESQARWFGTGYALVTRRAPEVDVALRPGTFEAVRVDAKAAQVAGDY